LTGTVKLISGVVTKAGWRDITLVTLFRGDSTCVDVTITTVGARPGVDGEAGTEKEGEKQ